MIAFLAVIALVAAPKRSFKELCEDVSSDILIKAAQLVAANARIQGSMTFTSPDASLYNRRYAAKAIAMGDKLSKLLSNRDLTHDMRQMIFNLAEQLDKITDKAIPARLTPVERAAMQRRRHIQAQLIRMDAFDIIANHDHGKSMLSDSERLSMVVGPCVNENPALLQKFNKVSGSNFQEKLVALYSRPAAAQLRERSAFKDLLAPENMRELAGMIEAVLDTAPETPSTPTAGDIQQAISDRLPLPMFDLIAEFAGFQTFQDLNGTRSF